MKARYKLVIIAILALLAVVFGPVAANAGGLDRTAVTGPTGIGNGSDQDGAWLQENLGSQIQKIGTQFVTGVEIMVPKFTYQDCWGRKWESKGVTHELPYLSYSQQLSEDRVVGVEISTKYGLGASFEKIYGCMDSRTLISGTYVEPFIAQRLSDHWSVGLGLVLVNSQLRWHGPFDVNRVYLPIDADTKAIGFGVGAAAGVFYQPTDDLAFGVNYTSSVKTRMSGRTEIQRPFHLRDRIKTTFEFPDQLEISGAWKATDRLLLVADWTLYGYSDNSLEAVKIRFNKLLINKPVNTNWVDNYAVRAGASYKLSDRWTVGGGAGYMSKAIPDKTVDFMTPDVAGYFVAGRVKYQATKSVSLTAGISRGWGSNKARGAEITADVWTGVLSASFDF